MSDSQSVAYREAQLGRTFDIDNHYYDWTDNFPGKLETDDVAAGRVPEITWWGTSYASILDGSYDDMIRARAEAVKAFGHPIFLRWAAEMNGDWFAWGGPENGDDPAAFVAAWRHIHDIFTSVGATNVSWVWCPNAESQPGGIDPTSWNNWRNYYPGDQYVNWVGIDGYNFGTLFNNGTDQWQSLGDIMSPIYDDYSQVKPVMIAETGSTEGGGSKAQWISDAAAWIEGHPDVKAFIYFDQTVQKPAATWDWQLDTSASSFAAYSALAKDPYFAPFATLSPPSPTGTVSTSTGIVTTETESSTEPSPPVSKAVHPKRKHVRVAAALEPVARKTFAVAVRTRPRLLLVVSARETSGKLLGTAEARSGSRGRCHLRLRIPRWRGESRVVIETTVYVVHHAYRTTQILALSSAQRRILAGR